MNTLSKVVTITGLPMRLVRLQFFLNMFRLIRQEVPGLKKQISTLRALRTKIHQYRGPQGIQKVIRQGERYYWDMYAEGFPSPVFDRAAVTECKKIHAESGAHIGMRNILFGITTRCPLQCEHCFEWDNLNHKEYLSLHDLTSIIEKLIAYGTSQIHFGGGEPMMRFEDMLIILKKYSPQVGFWMVTSGYNLTEQKARLLREAGLTGICVSLDHFEAQSHNAFRHSPKAFSMAMQAVLAGNQAGLITALSLCATKEFISRQNLKEYAELARNWGTSFIQLLEPKAAGHYAGKDVALRQDQKQMLVDFFLDLNSRPARNGYPTVIYHEFYQQTMGCQGAGYGNFYINPLGQVQACPFCRSTVGNLVTDSVEDCVDRLRSKGCASPMPAIKRKKIHQEVIGETELIHMG